MSFPSLGLSPSLLSALEDRGYAEPTPIQLQAIPAILRGRDVMAVAPTGSGKTAAFILPLLQRLAGGSRLRGNQVRALVLTPSRELAQQVGASVAAYGRHLALKSLVIYGGVKINPQMLQLRGGTDVLVATPGRLLDLVRRNAVKLGQVEILVLDESDRMLDLGFGGAIDTLLALLPRQRQNLLFSATAAETVTPLAAALLRRPLQLQLSPPAAAAPTVEQRVIAVDPGRKAALLSHLLRRHGWEQVLVFVRTKSGADRLVRHLEAAGLTAAALHGDKSQGRRTRVLAEFKGRSLPILVATDLAARGLDISQLPLVVNYELPPTPADYIHRIGRTGRAGLTGAGISLVSAEEAPLLAAIETHLGQALGREVEPGFDPTQPLPPTGPRPLRKKKPKKLKQRPPPELDR